MKERPILFSSPMVRAILEGSKTQTRRAIKIQPARQDMRIARVTEGKRTGKLFWVNDRLDTSKYFSCPYGQPGDRLWVRETFLVDDNRRIPKTATRKNFEVDYKATSEDSPHWRWRPSIHMPRWASRITLEITGIRVERLQDITEQDARAEGIKDGGCTECGNHEPCGCANPSPDARDAFCWLWNNINGAESWGLNPWVWVIEFKKC